MLQEAADKLLCLKSPVDPPPCVSILVTKSYLAVLKLLDAVVRDSDSVDVGSEVVENFLAGAGRFTVNNPVFFPDLLGNFLEETGFFHSFTELGPEDL